MGLPENIFYSAELRRLSIGDAMQKAHFSSLFLFFLHMPTDNYNSHQQQLKAKAHSTGNIS
jgi:hypothetical protein